MGKRLLLNDKEIRRTIIGAITEGLSYEDSYALAGVGSTTVEDWVRKGNEEGAREPYKSFAIEHANARRAGKLAKVRKISRSEDWRAQKWLLQVQFRDEFAGGDEREVRLGNVRGESFRSDIDTVVDFPSLGAEKAAALEEFVKTLLADELAAADEDEDE